MEDLLFPITRGAVLPLLRRTAPHVLFRVGKMDQTRLMSIREELATRLDRMWTDPPVPFRRQNHGDYEIPALTLKPGWEAPAQQGFRLHVDPRGSGARPPAKG